MILAMRDLLREYDLLDFHDGRGGNDSAKIRRSKRLLAPFGIDPAPWADENGIHQDALSKANAKRQIQRSKANRARAAAQLRELGPDWWMAREGK